MRPDSLTCLSTHLLPTLTLTVPLAEGLVLAGISRVTVFLYMLAHLPDANVAQNVAQHSKFMVDFCGYQ
jgi:hypothetical protein